MDRQRFHNLDAMRGVCALTVVLFHCSGLFARGEVFCHGFLAVDVFFVLSGFVIAHTYETRLADGMALRDFARARVWRLAPVYWLGTLLCTATLAAMAAFQPAGTFYGPGLIALLSAMAMLLIPQYGLGDLAYPANPVAWSLLGEVVANFLYARFLAARGGRLHAGIIVACWAACALYGYAQPHGWVYGARASDVFMTPLRAIPSFLAGVLIYRAWRAGYLDRLPALPPLALLLVWIVIAEVPTHGPTPTFDMIVATLLSPLLIVLLVRAKDTAPRPLLFLGAISYPLYASHLALINLARETPLLGFAKGPDPIRAGLVVAATLALAWAIHRLAERKKRARPALPTSIPA